MKVCIFTTSIDKKDGGPSRSVPILANGLAKAGVDVTLMTEESDDMNTQAVDVENVKLEVIPRNITTVELEKRLAKGGYDLIHGQGIWMPLYHKMCKIARKHNIPYMMTPRGALEPWCYNNANMLNRIKKHVAMAVYQRRDMQEAACVLTTAEMEFNNIRQLGFTCPLAIIPNGINFDDYPCRSKNSLYKCKKQIIFLSRVAPKKGVDILIDAWVKVHESYPSWNIIIVGNGEEGYIRSLNARIHRNGLENCVKILPPAFGEDKYRLYTESSLFVLPTHSENFGMVVAEALACGLPVITTKGAPWQLLEEKKCGWWIELSQSNLENTLMKVLALPMEELFNKGQIGAKIVRENFYDVEVAKKMTAVYEWIVLGKERPQYVIIEKNE